MSAEPVGGGGRRSFLLVDLSVVCGVVLAVLLAALVVWHGPRSVGARENATTSVGHPSTTARFVGADGPGPSPSTTAPTAAPTDVSPLTGLAVAPGGVPADRRAIAVKIDGFGGVPAVYGVDRADLVVEELVEGGLTRMVAVFQSQEAARVGPVRSVRTSDFQILAGLSRPVLVFSGGNPGTVAAAQLAPVLAFPPLHDDGVFWRDRALKPPHNLFTSTAGVASSVEPGNAPVPQFDRRPRGLAESGWPAAGVSVEFSASTSVGFVWSEAEHRWTRSLDGKPQLDGSGRALVADNVVVLGTTYGRSPFDSHSPEAEPIGTGPAWVFADGRVQVGWWSRPTPGDRWQLRSLDGSPMYVSPGRTWVELAPAGSPVGIG